MISTTRREALMGALLVPAAAGVPRIKQDVPTLVVIDPALAAGRRLAQAHGGEVLAIEGDRIRFARSMFERRPWLVIGVSRPADALLIEDVGREAGYVPVREGAEALRQIVAGAHDRGLVLGWVLAPRTFSG